MFKCKLDKAKITYHKLEDRNFQFEHCWHQLKNEPKWILHATKEPIKKRRINPTPNPTQYPFPIDDLLVNLEAENAIENDDIDLDPPIGRKAEIRKRKAQGMKFGGNHPT